jgi:hypothetical protein
MKGLFSIVVAATVCVLWISVPAVWVWLAYTPDAPRLGAPDRNARHPGVLGRQPAGADRGLTAAGEKALQLRPVPGRGPGQLV